MRPARTLRDQMETSSEAILMANRCRAALFALVTGLATSAAHGDYVRAEVVPLGDIGGGAPTYRVYLCFSDATDELEGVYASEHSTFPGLWFLTDQHLINSNGALAGTRAEDVLFPGLEPWDSWVTLGEDGPGLFPAVDVEFTPGLWGDTGNGESVLRGCRVRSDTGGYFNPDPDGDPLTGERILIGQFTVPGPFRDFYGRARWRRSGETMWRESDFRIFLKPLRAGDVDMSYRVDCGDLIAELSHWGNTDACGTDTTFDGVVDFADVLQVLSDWSP